MKPLRIVGGRGDRGFTLLEVLLAFVVFALSFAAVLEILAGSMRSTVRARGDTEAALLAQSLMDLVGTDIPLAEGTVAGEAPGELQWQMTISPYEPEPEMGAMLEVAETTGTVLFWVDLDISWDDGRRRREAHFSTVRSILQNFLQ